MNSIEQTDSFAAGRGASMLLPRRVGRFELIEQIGTGATSRVYRARDVESGGEVAVKVIHLESIAPDFQHRLRNEREIQGGIGHENIVRLIEWFELGDEFFLVMECVDGDSLWQKIHLGSGRIPFERARVYLLQILAGVEHLHQLGIVHRDIKPSNILLSRDGQVKLADFGIAKYDWQPGGAATRLGIGTPEYMSPEQASGREVDARSDLYSIGITFYEMLAGRSPFSRSDLSPKGFMEVVSALLTTPLPDPREQAPELSEQTVAFLLRATAKDPHERFQSCSQMRDALLEIGTGNVSSVPAPAATRLPAETVVAPARSYRRNGAILIGLLLLGGIAWAIVSSNDEKVVGVPGLSRNEALGISTRLARRYSAGWVDRSADSLSALYRTTGAYYLDSANASPAAIKSIVSREISAVGRLDSFALLQENTMSSTPNHVASDWSVIREYRPRTRTTVRDTTRYRMDLERSGGIWAIASQKLIDRRADTIIAPAPAVTRSSTASRTTVRTPAPARRTVRIPDVPAELRKIIGKGKPNRNPGKGKKAKKK